MTLSLVAEDEMGIVGHIAFSPIKINGEISNWFGLGPVSVAPTRQGEGIGSQLITIGMEIIKSMNADGVVLLGEPKYYGRFGFESNVNLTLPGVPSEYFMIQSFLGSERALPTGEVSYHQAFSG